MLKRYNGNADDVGRMIYCGRAIAIISVVIAHSAYARGEYAWLVRLVGSFASSGVAFFFFASGVYWKNCTWTALLEKLFRLGIPWLLLGTMTWLISCVGANAFSLVSWVSWVLGNGTYLWYLTVYSVTLILFHFLRPMKRLMLVLMCILTLLSRSVTAIAHISGSMAFLNPMNWIGFFSLGVLVGKDGVQKIVSSCRKWTIVAVLGILAGIAGDEILDARMDYWSYLNVFTQCAWIVAIVLVSQPLSLLSKGGLGRNSLFLYLSHMPVIGFLSNRLVLGTAGNVVLSIVTAVCLHQAALLIDSFFVKNQKLRKMFRTASGIHVSRGE